MSKYKFGKQSKRNLVGVNPKLIAVLMEALELGVMDFTVTCGYRSQEEQDRLYAQGRTEPGNIVTWVRKSKHTKGIAVDITPYPINWDDHSRFHQLAGIIKTVAAKQDVDIIWGGDWKKTKDLPHFELKE